MHEIIVSLTAFCMAIGVVLSFLVALCGLALLGWFLWSTRKHREPEEKKPPFNVQKVLGIICVQVGTELLTPPQPSVKTLTKEAEKEAIQKI